MVKRVEDGLEVNGKFLSNEEINEINSFFAREEKCKLAKRLIDDAYYGGFPFENVSNDVLDKIVTAADTAYCNSFDGYNSDFYEDKLWDAIDEYVNETKTDYLRQRSKELFGTNDLPDSFIDKIIRQTDIEIEDAEETMAMVDENYADYADPKRWIKELDTTLHEFKSEIKKFGKSIERD